MSWSAVAVLANVELQNPIGNDAAALVPPGDYRLARLTREQAGLRQFLASFTDCFGVRFIPTVLLIRDAAPPSYRTAEAVASFRNMIALSAVTYGRARALRNPGRVHAVFGETFSFYPWMVGADGRHLYSHTPAQLGIHIVDRFRGQSSPYLFRLTIGDGDLDQPLLDELLTRWLRIYSSPDAAWADRALFRSLNMAYQATMMPAGIATTIFDLGRVLALWVSAFEILAHPGPSGRSNCFRVMDMIEGTRWRLGSSGQRGFTVRRRGNEEQRTLAAWLYYTINNHRNDFMHGNPIAAGGLDLPDSERSIADYAAPLYRVALTSFLRLAPHLPAPSMGDPDAFGAAVAASRDHDDHQRIVEEALLTVVTPPPVRPTTGRILPAS